MLYSAPRRVTGAMGFVQTVCVRQVSLHPTHEPFELDSDPQPLAKLAAHPHRPPMQPHRHLERSRFRRQLLDREQGVASVVNFSYQRGTELTAAVLFLCPVGVVSKPAGRFPS